MAEGPLGTLGRILAGVALVQGRLGHQVLGQLLIAGTNDAAIAAAAVVVAGTTKTRNAAAQVALRTAAPAIAVHALLQGEEKRINRLDELVRERQKQLAAHISKVEQQNRGLIGRTAFLEREKATVEEQLRALSEETDRLRLQLDAVPAAPAKPAKPTKRRAAPRKPPSAKPPQRPRKKPGR